jgi:hypothetical protein
LREYEDPLNTPLRKSKDQNKINSEIYSFKALTKTDYLSQPEASNLLKFKHPQVPFPKGKPIYKFPIKEGQHPYFED